MLLSAIGSVTTRTRLTARQAETLLPGQEGQIMITLTFTLTHCVELTRFLRAHTNTDKHEQWHANN